MNGRHFTKRKRRARRRAKETHGARLLLATEGDRRVTEKVVGIEETSLQKELPEGRKSGKRVETTQTHGSNKVAKYDHSDAR